MEIASWENVEAGRPFSEYLKELENIAEVELQSQESRKCIADAKALQSLSDKELGGRIQVHMQSSGGRKFSESELRRVVDKMKSIIPFNVDAFDDEQIRAFNLLIDILSNRYKEDYKKYRDKLLPLKNAIDKIYAAIEMKRIIKSMRGMKFPIDSEKDIAILSLALFLAFKAHELGYLSGFILRVNEEYNNPYLEDIMHRIHSGRLLSEKRYTQRSQQYQQALADAENLWKNGNKDSWWQMAGHLIENDYPDLNYETLKKKLLPIAEKYGKGLSAKKKKRGQPNPTKSRV